MFELDLFYDIRFATQSKFRLPYDVGYIKDFNNEWGRPLNITLSFILSEASLKNVEKLQNKYAAQLIHYYPKNIKDFYSNNLINTNIKVTGFKPLIVNRKGIVTHT